MNLLFFLTPKSEVLYVDSHDTVRQVMERMEYHTYQAIPMIDSYGHYVGTITEGDILWWIKDDLPFDMKKAETEYIGDIPRKRENLPVSIQSDMEDLMSKAVNQNFVPVVDDKDIFIGIITRKDIIQYLDRQRRQAMRRRVGRAMRVRTDRCMGRPMWVRIGRCMGSRGWMRTGTHRS